MSKEHCVTPFNARRSMSVCSLEDKLYFFGGVGAKGTESILDVSNDFWSYDLVSCKWTDIRASTGRSGPSARRCMGFTSSGNSTLLLWGGSSIIEANKVKKYNFLNDFWEYDIESNEWSQLEQSDNHLESPIDGYSRPVPRYTPIFEYINNKALIFGGYTEDKLGKRKLNDLWLKKGDNLWEEISSVDCKVGYDITCSWPGLRYGSMSARNSNKIYVCGGFSDGGDHIDVWEFNLKHKKWKILSGDNARGAPEPRYCATFAFYDNKLILFGGRSRQDAKANFNDVYIFHLNSCTWEEVHPNTDAHEYSTESSYPAYHAKSSVCINGTDLYLWGGEGINGHVSDFWKLDLVQLKWTQLYRARDDDPIFW